LEFFRIKLRKQKGDEENELQRRRDLESFVERTLGAITNRVPFIRGTVHRNRGALEKSRKRLLTAIKAVGGALTKWFARPVDLDGPSTERDVKGPER
jgi:hypothetical protein